LEAKFETSWIRDSALLIFLFHRRPRLALIVMIDSWARCLLKYKYHRRESQQYSPPQIISESEFIGPPWGTYMQGTMSMIFNV
jgi:hypothetical protein